MRTISTILGIACIVGAAFLPVTVTGLAFVMLTIIGIAFLIYGLKLTSRIDDYISQDDVR